VGCALHALVGLERASVKTTPYSKDSAHINADPVGFLRELHKRTDALDQYRLTFTRQERFGFIPKLGSVEKIRAAFRNTPFSVKFEWDDPERDYFECVYVDGQNESNLLVRERKGLLGFAPQVRAVNVMDPVTFGRSKNPITDFGLAQIVRRTLLPFDDPEVVKVASIRYEGLVELEPTKQPSHHLFITCPPTETFRYPRRDFYVDAQTLLPAGTDLYTADGKLDASYRYTEVDTNVKLTDADFRLAEGR
jgi:hypothetical protein